MRYAVIIYTDTTSEAAIADYMQQRRWDRGNADGGSAASVSLSSA